MSPESAISLLVVDDDQNHRRMLRNLLEEWGYRVTGADSGEDAVALCREQPFDLVLMDVRMGGMSGDYDFDSREIRHVITFEQFVDAKEITALLLGTKQRG